MNEENTVTNTKAPKKEKKKQPLVCEIFDYLEIFVFAATAVLLLFTFSIRLCTVDGDSMFDTLKNGLIVFPVRQGGLILMITVFGIFRYKEQFNLKTVFMLISGIAGIVLLNMNVAG